MGIPKFYRWMSERYPLCSQLVEKTRIPEFDNLYLDMNGILHNCSHKNDAMEAALPPEKMFPAIFNYVEHLFGTIKPQKVFLIAIDGVAPRAKMNQQRSRRFRSAKEAHDVRSAAQQKGIELPEGDFFDSNCITPGTQFMEEVSMQLTYFIAKKISEDSSWRNVKVIFSGHDVPGEGEHKIAEFIRAQKASDDYNPETRHCLYGLDADLIMLGLLSHDPHFCLLREEVVFGPHSKRETEVERQNFYLMHLSLLREYLEIEFGTLSESLSFPYDFERIIDDFILLAFFVGNDFLPELPGLHINEGALSLLFKCYKDTLPEMDGYINDCGVINMKRLAAILDELEQYERAVYNKQVKKTDPSNALYDIGIKAMDLKRSKKAVFTKNQKRLFELVRDFRNSDSPYIDLEMSSQNDIKFLKLLTLRLKLTCSIMLKEDGTEFLRIAWPINFDETEQGSSKFDDDQEVNKEILKYELTPVMSSDVNDRKTKYELEDSAKFETWKNAYYTSKLHFKTGDSKAVEVLTKNYVEGLQWVLFYYYRGCPSWGWFYRYHYAPLVADVNRGLRDNIDFEKDEPFKPLEQLMSVLPSRSKKLVPIPFQDLMVNETSPIRDFYPENFQIDLNGKKNAWEAVVAIPFIDAERLKSTLKQRVHLLKPEEIRRNQENKPSQFYYSGKVSYVYRSPLCDIFPEFSCHCHIKPIDIPKPTRENILVGLHADARPGHLALAGFPSLQTLKWESKFKFGVDIFMQKSRNVSIYLLIENERKELSNEELADKFIGKTAYYNWPYLQEALIVEVCNSQSRYERSGGNRNLISKKLSQSEYSEFSKNLSTVISLNRKRGIEVPDASVLVKVAPLKGMKRTDSGAQIKDFDLHEDRLQFDLSQLIVLEEDNDGSFSRDQRYIEQPATSIHDELPVGTIGFFLGSANYGRPLQVINYAAKDKADIYLATPMRPEPTYVSDTLKALQEKRVFLNSSEISRRLHVNWQILGKITSSWLITHGKIRVNIGLRLKYEGKKMKVLGYTEKLASGWVFSEAAFDLIADYCNQFPKVVMALRKSSRAVGMYFEAGNTLLILSDEYTSEQIFGDEADNEMERLRIWIKEHHIRDFQQVPVSDNTIFESEYGPIESAGEMCFKHKAAVVPKIVKNVPREAILKPQNAHMMLRNQRFHPGNRAVYVLDTGKVPIGTIGTIVSVTTDTVTIISDTPFMGGTNLSGHCSEHRGMIVSKSAILNLSLKQYAYFISQKNSHDSKRDAIISALRGSVQQSDQHQNHDQSSSGSRNRTNNWQSQQQQGLPQQQQGSPQQRQHSQEPRQHPQQPRQHPQQQRQHPQEQRRHPQQQRQKAQNGSRRNGAIQSNPSEKRQNGSRWSQHNSGHSQTELCEI